MKRLLLPALFLSITLFHLPLGVCTAAEDDTRAVGAVGVREPRQPSTYALLIGIDDYQGNARNLKCAVKDTLGLAETLKISVFPKTEFEWSAIKVPLSRPLKISAVKWN
jgi:hypothetical protein